jgi:putative transposase
MRLAAIYQRPNTSKAATMHKIYPYLLGGLADRPEQISLSVARTSLTSRMAKDFLYLVIIVDWVSRAVLA